MNELLKKRIERKLDALSDERAYQILDYIEFLESKYGERTVAAPSPFQRLAETVEDTLRAGKVSAGAIRGTMDVMAAAGRLMSGFAAAGRAVVDQVAGGGASTPAAGAPPAPGSEVSGEVGGGGEQQERAPGGGAPGGGGAGRGSA